MCFCNLQHPSMWTFCGIEGPHRVHAAPDPRFGRWRILTWQTPAKVDSEKGAPHV